MKLIIAKTILALCVLSMVIALVTNPSLWVPLLTLPIGVLIGWALSEVIDD